MNSIPNILVWNTQGAGSRRFLTILRDHIQKNSPSILALVETRISGPRARLICNSIGFRRNVRVEAHGFQGGIWVLWNEEDLDLDVIQTHAQYVTLGVKLQNQIGWFVTIVYASPHLLNRELLWLDLQHFAENCQLPWLLAGDFNETINLEERNHGGPDMQRRCDRFKYWIENNGLLDLGYSGPKFTWSRGLSLGTRKEARLDRALCNAQWRLKFQEGAVRHLIRIGSDHSPLLIATGGFVKTAARKPPFRFLAAWLSHSHFEQLVHENWSPIAPLSRKLQHLASNLERWNRDVFGNLFFRKRQLWARIDGIQRALSSGGPQYLRKLEHKLRAELDHTLDQIDMLWYQKARVHQIRDGDRNTKYFHASTIVRRRINRIEALRDSDNFWQHDPEMIQGMVTDYFRQLFSEEANNLPGEPLRTMGFPPLSAHWSQDLARPFTPEDVRLALKGMHPFKAPGPDGFHAVFFQRFWHLVGADVNDTVLNILVGNELPQLLNDTFITLIPKVPNPERVQQLRPIGLCNVVYKLVTKCIVNRLKRVLPLLISPMQSSFIPGRQITDNIIVMQELLHTMRRKSGTKGWMAIKLDLEKAYDRLRWSFIRETLDLMHLPSSLVNVIMNCVTSSSFRILWNGEPTEPFKPSRGVRQGDPLSPYLFVACMERLSQLIEWLCVEGHWKAIPVTRGGTQVSHLMFADDIVLFGEASRTQAEVMIKCLTDFCAWSGQKVNTQKSSVYFSPNTNEATAAEICNVLGISKTDDLGRYLGVPTINGRVTRATFQEVLSKVDKRLAGWKTKYLSLAGRATLIQATLTSIPAYVMQSARLPRSLCDDLDRKFRRFLWGGSNSQRKPHLVRWI